MTKSLSLLALLTFLSFFSVVFYFNIVLAENVAITARVQGVSTNGGSSHYISPELKQKILRTADFNHDGRVDIIDLSILLFYYGKSGPAITYYDLSNDGFISLEDISIMLYYWTLLQ